MTLLSAFILTSGIWRAVLLTPGGELPFMMEVTPVNKTYTLTVINGDERMLLDDVMVKGDSLLVRFPVYESELHLLVKSADELEGSFINLTRTKNGTIPLVAHAGKSQRFRVANDKPMVDISGRWPVTFGPGTKDSSQAIGVFKQNGTHVTGTFLSTSGDYRFLEGAVDNDSLFLSTFNGVFVYLFKGKVSGNKITGMYYSGTHYNVDFTGYKNNDAQLPDPDAITTYNEGANGFRFSFPDVDSNMVSLDDDRFKNKVIIVQILGSWCPNCLDETAFLAPYYEKNKNRGMEIIGLSFEKTDDFVRASSNVKRFRDRFKVRYPLLIASNRDKIKTTLPGLQNFAGFPSTIYLDRKHRIRKIHAGFSGPATGTEYEKFKDDFYLFMDKLLGE